MNAVRLVLALAGYTLLVTVITFVLVAVVVGAIDIIDYALTP
jgi:hypothetical protein